MATNFTILALDLVRVGKDETNNFWMSRKFKRENGKGIRCREKYEKKKLQKFLLFTKINVLKYFLFLNSIEKPAFVIEDVNN